MKNEWKHEIKAVFKETPERYAAHERCKPILEEMAVSKEFLFDIIRENLSDAKFLARRRTYPTLSLNIVDSSDFTFVVNVFPSLPDKRTNISFQSIHPHGSLLLSTVGAMGPGYQSMIFKKEF